jgi:hypothetical protein
MTSVVANLPAPAVRAAFCGTLKHDLARTVDTHLRERVPAKCGFRIFEKGERCVHVVFPSTKEKLIVSNVGSGGHYRFTLYGLPIALRKDDYTAGGTMTYDNAKGVFLHDDDIDYSVIGFINDPLVSLEQGLTLFAGKLRACNVEMQ